MPDLVLAADTQRPLGSRNSRRLRHAGRIPAVVYGHGVTSTPVSVDARALRAALSTTAGANAVFELDVEGTHHLAMAKVIDRHPVRHTIAHVDFIVVSRDQKVTADVPVTLIGESEAVRQAGGVIEQVLHALTVSMLPSQIPDSIHVDVSSLEPGDAIRVGEITLPDGVTTDVDPDTSVVNAAHAIVIEEPAPEAEAAEGAEGAAAAEGGGAASAEAASSEES
jgi:large subunit ribosomal protein L25